MKKYNWSQNPFCKKHLKNQCFVEHIEKNIDQTKFPFFLEFKKKFL